MIRGIIIIDGDETVINNDIKITYLEINILKYTYVQSILLQNTTNT